MSGLLPNQRAVAEDGAAHANAAIEALRMYHEAERLGLRSLALAYGRLAQAETTVAEELLAAVESNILINKARTK